MEDNRPVEVINIVKDSVGVGGEGQFQCEECLLVCKTIGALKQHKTYVHKDKLFVCNVCGVEVNGWRKWFNHKRIHAPKVECPHCPKQVNRRHLARHIASCSKPKPPPKQKPKKKKPEKRFMCDLCGFASRTELGLTGHMKVHQKKDKKTKCSYCTFSRERPDIVKKHEDICPFKKMQIPSQNGQVTNQSLIDLFSDTEVSLTQHNKYIKYIPYHTMK